MSSVTVPMVSVVVPTYGREKVLCDTLRCLFAQDYRSYEVIVVDQTPVHEPRVVEFLDEAREKNLIRYLLVGPPNLPQARNVGARAAVGEIIIFVDDDVFVDPDWIGAHVSAYAREGVSCVAGRVVYPPSLDLGTPGFPVGTFLRDGTCMRGFGRETPEFAESGPGGNLSVQARLLREVGGFDAGFVGNSLREESDFCMRVKAAGYRIYFDPRAKIIHRRAEGGCRTSAPPDLFRDTVRNETRFFLRNFPHADLPLFLWRMRKQLLLPTPGWGLQTGRLAAGFPGQIGFVLGVASYLRHRKTVTEVLV